MTKSAIAGISLDPQGMRDRPNVVVILADDIGCGDIGYYHRKRTGNKEIIPTPNIDRLIDKGVRFSNAHSCALCAPTRYTVLTGNYTFRCHKPWGVWSAYEKSAIQPDQTTLGHCMQEAGYHTSFFGKWHLGGQWYLQGSDKLYNGPEFGKETDAVDAARGYASGGPGSLGFDYSCTLPAGIQAPPFAFFENDEWMKLNDDSAIKKLKWKEMPKGCKLGSKGAGASQGDSNYDSRGVGYMLAKKAVDYIENHQEKKSDQPFFMYYCSQAVHHPHSPPDYFMDEKVKGTTPSEHGDMIRELDMQVGMIIERLKSSGVYNNTLFIFTSDNGGLEIEETQKSGHDSSNGLRAYKGSIYEGGHRVPLIAVWPGKIKPNKVCDKPVLTQDIMATLYELTSRKVPQDQARDSFSFYQSLFGKNNAPARKTMLISTGKLSEDNMKEKTPFAIAVYEDGYKLIATWLKRKNDYSGPVTPVALFNLMDNPLEDESNNLIDEPKQKDRVQRMLKIFEQMRATRTNGRTTPIL